MILDELATHSLEAVDQEPIVRVDEADFARSLRVARRWDCRHEFSLLSHDCVEFLRAVGDALNLPMPKRYPTRWTPQAYVRALLASVREGKLEIANAVYEGSIMNDLPVGQGSLKSDYPRRLKDRWSFQRTGSSSGNRRISHLRRIADI